MSTELISKEGAIIIVIDIQEKLFPKMARKEELIRNVEKLIRFAGIMKIPILLTEQYPKGLGRTIVEVKNILPKVKPIEKVEFSCLRSEKFKEAIEKLGAKTLIITGIETHICVTQTALDGVKKGYRVCVVRDAVTSRSLDDESLALERMRQCGVTIVSTEMLIYEMLGKAGTPEFKEALKLVK